MDSQEVGRYIFIGATGMLAGAAVYELLSPGSEPVYTGLSREYKKKSSRNIAASIFADAEKGYEIRFEEKAIGNPFPDFVSPFFTVPFAAALYADEVAYQLDFRPAGPWAQLTNDAASARDAERVKS